MRKIENEVMNVILPEEHGEMDATGGYVAWEAASIAWGSKAEMGRSGESWFGVNREDFLEETRRSVGQSLDSLQSEDGLEERERQGGRERGREGEGLARGR